VLHIVAIDTRPPPPNPASNAASKPCDYHIIPFTRIATCQILSLQQSGDGSIASALPPIGPVDTKQLQKREAQRIQQLKDEENDRGKGVSREAQAIYDALKKMYDYHAYPQLERDANDITHSNIPVRWHNQEIIVQEHVIILPPYRPEDCKAGKERQDSLGRVRKVLEGERRKLKDKEEKERKSGVATPTGPRKGG
jgi:hypothetical protein